MIQHFRKVLDVPYEADDLFDLIADVEAYPRFLPWVLSMRVQNQPASPPLRRANAEARIGYKRLSETFVTAVESDASQRSVKASLIRGPFRHLETQWIVTPLPTGAGADAARSRVQFVIRYQFKNPLFQAMLLAGFEPVVNRLMRAFMEEAARRQSGAAALPPK